jgi:exosortase/archaeosortase family protein
MSASPHRSRTSSGRRAQAHVSDDAALRPDAVLVRVALIFVVIFALLQAAILGLAYIGMFDRLMVATASLTGACSAATGVVVTVRGNEIFLATRILSIDLDCTGLSLAAIYAAIVLAYPLSAKSKVIGLAVGLPIIFVANFARLVAVVQLSGRLGDDAFLFVHDYLFMVAMVAAVVAVWAAFLSWAKRNAS